MERISLIESWKQNTVAAIRDEIIDNRVPGQVNSAYLLKAIHKHVLKFYRIHGTFYGLNSRDIYNSLHRMTRTGE